MDLMYRLFGFPARYASGYALQPSDFIQQEDGTWLAEVTDESAHAWTEIFLEDYGWTPVEVTPASDGSYSTSYPGMDTEALEGIVSAMDLRADTSGTQADSGGEAGTGQRGEEEGAWGFLIQIDPDKYHDLILVLAAVLTESLILLPLFLDYAKLSRKRKIERMNCRAVFGRFLKMLHAAGCMTGYHGMEEDFSEKLPEALPCVCREEAERMVEIVSRAAYGCGEITEEENEFVRKIYFRAEGWICEKAGKAEHRKAGKAKHRK